MKEHTVNADLPPEDPESDESLLVPPDEPLAALEDATTASGRLEGDSINERLTREEPDRLVCDENLVYPVEEGAIRVRRNAPGGTDDESDGYQDQEPS